MIFLLNKIIEEIKKTEQTADNIIRDSHDKAENIINNAHKEADKLIERIKEEAKKEGKMIIEREENIARMEADNTKKNCEREKEEIGIKSLKNIEKAVKIVIKKVMEGE